MLRTFIKAGRHGAAALLLGLLIAGVAGSPSSGWAQVPRDGAAADPGVRQATPAEAASRQGAPVGVGSEMGHAPSGSAGDTTGHPAPGSDRATDGPAPVDVPGGAPADRSPPPAAPEPGQGARPAALAVPRPGTVPGLGAAGLAQGSTAATGSGEAAADVTALVRLLENPAARDELLARLRTLESAGSATPPASPPIAFLDRLSRQINGRVDELVATTQAVGAALTELPYIVEWLRQQVGNEFRRQFWARVLQGVGLMVGAGLVVAIALARLVRRPVARLVPRAGDSLPRRIAVRALGLAIDIVPVAGFIAASILVLRVQPLATLTVTVGSFAVLAVSLHRMLVKLTHHLLDAEARERRWIAMDEGDARTLATWIRRTGTTAIFGYFGLQAADRLGLPPQLYDALAQVLFITVAAMATVWLLRTRDAFERTVRDAARTSRELPFLRAAVPWDMLASSGCWLAVALVWAHYLVWAIGLREGFRFLFFGTAVTAVTIVAAQLALRGVRGLEERWRPAPARLEDGQEATDPGKGGGTLAFMAATLLVRLVAVLVVLQGWNIDILGWLASPSGRDALAGVMRVAIILGGAFLAWLLLDRWIAQYMIARDTSGNLLHSNRSRTLANIGRNVLLVTVALFTGATVLSEMGVDTAPLLAGAGVVGLAVGFGSQTLVKDIITGLFILLGDTMRVGDIVSIGGKGGVVEAMSMRAVGLRDYDGSVHTIPYGAIDTVTNLTKDFSYWVFKLSVAYEEDVDRVMDILRELDEKIRKEWPYRRLILEPLEIAGVDQFAESGIVILARIKTRPAEQWRVGREMQRRIKIEFERRGIEIPYPHHTVFLAGDKQDAASRLAAAQLRRDADKRAQAEASKRPEPLPPRVASRA